MENTKEIDTLREETAMQRDRIDELIAALRVVTQYAEAISTHTHDDDKCSPQCALAVAHKALL